MVDRVSKIPRTGQPKNRVGPAFPAAILTNFSSPWVDSAGAGKTSIDASATIIPTEVGMALNCVATNGFKPLETTTGLGTLVGLKEYTVMMLIYVGTLGTLRYIMSDLDSGGSGRTVEITLNAANTYTFSQIDNVPAVVSVTGGTVAVGWHWLAMEWDGPDTGRQKLRAYVDDVLIGTATAATMRSTGGVDYRIGRGGAYTANGFDGLIAAHGVFKGAIYTNNNSLRKNPWAMFAPRTRRVFVSAAANAPVFDASSNSGYQTAQSTYTWAHTCTGTNRFLRVSFAKQADAPSRAITALTYNGVALTYIGGISSGTGIQVRDYGLVNPASGSNTISVTFEGAIDSIGFASSYTNVHQSSPTEAVTTDSLTNVGAADATVTVTSVTNNALIVGTVISTDTTITVGAGQTSRGNVAGALFAGASSDEGPKTPAGAVTFNWTDVGASQTWAIVGFAIKPFVAGGTTFTQAVTATSALSASVIRSTLKTVAASSAMMASALKRVSKSFSASSAMTASVSTIKVILLTITATTVAMTANLSKRVGKIATASSAMTASVSRMVGKIATATSAMTASAVKRVSKSFSATSAMTASAATIKVILLTINVTAVAMTANVSRRVGKVVNATSAMTASMSKQVQKTISATLALTASAEKRVTKTVSASSAMTASILKQVRKSISATILSSANISTVFTPGVAVTFVANTRAWKAMRRSTIWKAAKRSTRWLPKFRK